MRRFDRQLGQSPDTLPASFLVFSTDAFPTRKSEGIRRDHSPCSATVSACRNYCGRCSKGQNYLANCFSPPAPLHLIRRPQASDRLNHCTSISSDFSPLVPTKTLPLAVAARFGGRIRTSNRQYGFRDAFLASSQQPVQYVTNIATVASHSAPCEWIGRA